MRGEVVAHAQLRGQIHNERVVAEQVVVVDVPHAQLGEGLHQVLVLVRQPEDELKAFVLAGEFQAHAAIGGGGQGQKNSLLTQVLRQLAHMANGAASTVVQHGQHHRELGLGDARHIQRQAVGLCRVCLHKGHDSAFVARVQAAQGFHGGFFAGAFAVAKAHAAGVQHKRVEQVQVAPAGLCCALAEIVFFAVAFAEVFGIEKADLRQAVAAYIHAKAHASGHIHHRAGVGLCAQGIEPRGVVASRKAVVFAKPGVAADGGVVGKRRDRGHLAVAIGGATNAVEPVVGHLGVAVQEQHVVAVAQGHAAVDGADEAEVLGVLQQGDAAVLRGALAQPGSDLGFGAGIVDDDEAPGALVGAGQHGVDAQAGVGQAPVHRDDDVYWVLRWRDGRRCDGRLGMGGRLLAAAQQAVQSHLGVNDGAGGAEHGGIFDGVKVLGQFGQVVLEAGGFLLPVGALPGGCLIGFFQQLTAVLRCGEICLHMVQPACGVAAVAFQLGNAVVQRAHCARQCYIVRRHGPAQFDLQRGAFLGAGGQQCGGDGQFEPGLVTGEQQQCGARCRRQGGLPDDLAVGCGSQQRAGVGVGRPLPEGGAVCAAQGQAVQVHEPRAVGRVQAQLGDGHVLAGQLEMQGLAFLANDAGRGELARLAVMAVVAQIELGGEPCLGRRGRCG